HFLRRRRRGKRRRKPIDIDAGSRNELVLTSTNYPLFLEIGGITSVLEYRQRGRRGSRSIQAPKDRSKTQSHRGTRRKRPPQPVYGPDNLSFPGAFRRNRCENR